MRRLIIPLAILLMAGLLAVSFAVDCANLTAQSGQSIEQGDAELRKHEERLIQALEGWANPPAEIRTSIDVYRQSPDWQERHSNYFDLVGAVTRGLATDPPLPAVADGAKGAINRREVAEKNLEEIFDHHRRWLATTRGKVGQMVLNWWKGSRKKS
jgi:hypothetical protein